MERWSGVGRRRGLGEARRGWKEKEVTERGGESAFEFKTAHFCPAEGGGNSQCTWQPVA